MKTYQGSCHCTHIQYEVTLDLTQPVIECNCSHCAIKGLLLQFVTSDAFTLKSDTDLKEYRFNTHKITHTFCGNCGVEPFGNGNSSDGTPMVAINVRTITDVDLEALTRTPVNGKEF